jgi:hypothetical protein
MMPSMSVSSEAIEIRIDGIDICTLRTQSE